MSDFDSWSSPITCIPRQFDIVYMDDTGVHREYSVTGKTRCILSNLMKEVYVGLQQVGFQQVTLFKLQFDSVKLKLIPSFRSNLPMIHKPVVPPPPPPPKLRYPSFTELLENYSGPKRTQLDDYPYTDIDLVNIWASDIRDVGFGSTAAIEKCLMYAFAHGFTTLYSGEDSENGQVIVGQCTFGKDAERLYFLIQDNYGTWHDYTCCASVHVSYAFTLEDLTEDYDNLDWKFGVEKVLDESNFK